MGDRLDERSRLLVRIARALHRAGWLAATDGNLSYRSGEEVVITPSGVAKARLHPRDLARLDLSGTALFGRPSSEAPLHLAVYRHCPPAGAAIHAHPPHAVALTVARPELARLPAGALSELVPAAGEVPVVPYAPPGGEALAAAAAPFLPRHRVLILARHGVLTWGETLEEALFGVERVEHACRILCLALQMGGITELPPAEVETLRALRRQLGERIR